ncbi:MAG: ATP-binding protein [Acidobacteriota bacterium]|jgi:predicted AAA+ superfamily ATPase
MRHYLPRLLRPAIARALNGFPAILVTGPRQSGKTTLLREEFGEGTHYVTFDDPLEREFARNDPEGFLDRFGEGRTLLDEVQYVPEVFQYLKMRIDRDRARTGRWLLTGSQQFGLMARVTESLAGRVAILELLPLGLAELPEEEQRTLSEEIWLGGYPEPRLHAETRDPWMSSYIQTYVERDVRQLHNIRDLRSFETFVALCSARHAQVLNVAGVSREAGISQPTVKSWLGALEAAYLVHLLPPYFESFGKRVVKSPKLYFLDSGLACTLTRQPTGEAALAGAMGGALFEGWVVSEAVKALTFEGKRPELYYWRSHDGLEVDLLLRAGNRLVPVEIKLTATPNPRHVQPLERFKRMAGNAATDEGVLVCRVRERRPLPHGNVALPWNEFPEWVRERVSGHSGS